MVLLLVEDDEDLGRALTRALQEEGFTVHWTKQGDDGLYLAREWDCDLVILDRMLPGLDGLEILRRLRRDKRVPILMLTALNRVENRVEGLEGGADDYLGKPFELTELFARVRALIRRSSEWTAAGLVHGDIRLDPVDRKVFRAGTEVVLSASEFDTVELLLSRQGRTVSKQVLEDRLYSDGAEVGSNSLEVHIHRIRAKLGKEFIKTRRGVGYLVEAPRPRA
ncbi:MAG TPA: response regulator transcription factor [Opitutus sp.]|nr:response regulator transcription factor [Opitutus sp.]